MEGIATKPLKTTQNHSGASPNTLAWKVGLTYGSITKDSNIKTKICFMDIIEERKGYKMTYKELRYLLYFQRYSYYECFRTENHKKWLNSVGRCVLMVLTYLNTLGTHGACKKMIFFFTVNT